MLTPGTSIVQAYGQGEGRGFAFGGVGLTRITVAASGMCTHVRAGDLINEEVTGERTVTLHAHIHGEWKTVADAKGVVSTAGELMIEETDEANNMGLRIVIVDPPFVITGLR